jgi:hypothetical protein
MQHGVIHDDLTAFKEVVARPLHETMLATPPRMQARCIGTMAVSRHSARLAKKAAHQTPIVATTQNMLMMKLGLLTTAKVLPDDLDCYSKLFMEAMSEEQVIMTQDLFMHHVPDLELTEKA